MNVKENEISIDLMQLNKTAYLIKEEVELFESNYNELLDCIKELSLCWSSESAKSFFKSVENEILTLDAACSVYKKLSDDYFYAADCYCKIEQETKNIVNMVK